MLYYVSGPVTVLEPGLAVIDCGGVGYGCRVTAYTAGQLKLNQSARLFITESIREDAFDLYGFISKEEQRCFELLTSVTGVGPKAAIAILSAGPQNVTLAVMTFPAILHATTLPIAGAAALIAGLTVAWCGFDLFKTALSCCTIVLVLEFFLV
jgi:hypothetical protein